MRRVITTASLLLLFSSSLLAAPVYKWVDARGVTHFSAEPPVNQKAESIKTNSFQPKAPENQGENPLVQHCIEGKKNGVFHC